MRNTRGVCVTIRALSNGSHRVARSNARPTFGQHMPAIQDRTRPVLLPAPLTGGGQSMKMLSSILQTPPPLNLIGLVLPAR